MHKYKKNEQKEYETIEFREMFQNNHYLHKIAYIRQ